MPIHIEAHNGAFSDVMFVLLVALVIGVPVALWIRTRSDDKPPKPPLW